MLGARGVLGAAAMAVALGLGRTPACAATLTVTVNLAAQRMLVAADGEPLYVWPVSTARAGYVTARGRFHPIWLDANHRSHRYDNVPMPHSIFFHGGEAIHGTYGRTEVRHLGHRASHGCIRLRPDHAATLFRMVEEVGRARTWIIVQ
jgi:lipoprotein-anchoring transpeptidase ErfK/SrfK